jgi:ABC-2 type transport system permease protein
MTATDITNGARSAGDNGRRGNSRMKLRTGDGWTRGLETMLRFELQHWFGTKTWLTQILLWAGIFNGVFLMVGLTAPAEELPSGGALTILNIFMALGGPIGVSIMMQEAVVGEKRSGTAAWVLSKPASRAAFIVSKLVGNSAGVAVTMILAQGLIAYLIAVLVMGFVPPVDGFLAGLGVQFANMLFYLTLTLMLGVLLDHPAPVIAIPIGVLFGQNFLSSAYPPLFKALPWALAMPINNSDGIPLATALMTGAPVESLLPLITTLTMVVIFVVVALRRFEHQEL